LQVVAEYLEEIDRFILKSFSTVMWCDRRCELASVNGNWRQYLFLQQKSGSKTVIFFGKPLYTGCMIL
jgi:hypothetical protein